MDDLISRQAAISELRKCQTYLLYEGDDEPKIERSGAEAVIMHLPSEQPEIICCKKCKHWTRTCGDEKWGLGDCDVFDKHLVMCNGYCAWAERHGTEEQKGEPMRAIDGDALTKRLVEFCNKNCPYTDKSRNLMCGSCFMGLALESVDDAPTIEPERKKGKWINSYKRQTCSVCKQRGYRSWSFCPNCGADMRGEQE